MSTTTLTVAPETLEAPPAVLDETTRNWTLSFDINDDEHCFGPLDTIISDLPDNVLTALGLTKDMPLDGLTHLDVRANLDEECTTAEDLLENVDEETDPAEHARLTDLVDALSAAQWKFEPCTQCQCGLDQWQSSDQDWFNTAIAESADTLTWAIFDSGGKPRLDLAETPGVSELWDALNSRDGWSAVTLSWDAATRTLDFTFGSYPSNWHGKAVALTAEQETLAEAFRDLDTYQDEPYCFVLTADPSAVTVVINLWGDDRVEDLKQLCLVYDNDPQAAVTAVTARMAGLPEQARTAAAMISQGWTSTLDDLLLTVTAIAA